MVEVSTVINPYSFREIKKISFPSGVGLEIVGNHCNLKCAMCYLPEGERKDPTHLEVDLVGKIINESAALGVKEFYFLGGGESGGEPTLHKDFIPLVKYASEKGMKPLTVTNGLALANPRYAEELFETPGVMAVIRRNVIIPEHASLQDKIGGGVRGYYEKLGQAFSNIEELVSRGRINPDQIVVQCNTIKDLRDSGAIIDVFQYAREQGFHVAIEAVRKGGARYKRGTDYDLSPVELINLFRDLAKIDEQRFGQKHMQEIFTVPYFAEPCTMTQTGIHIKSNGDVISCCGQSIIHGNLFETHSLTEVVNSNTLEVFRDQSGYIAGPCKSCDIYMVCQGGCRGEAAQTGCPRASDPYCERVVNNPEIMTLSDLAPKVCSTCPLEGNPNCHLPEPISLVEAGYRKV